MFISNCSCLRMCVEAKSRNCHSVFKNSLHWIKLTEDRRGRSRRASYLSSFYTAYPLRGVWGGAWSESHLTLGERQSARWTVHQPIILTHIDTNGQFGVRRASSNSHIIKLQQLVSCLKDRKWIGKYFDNLISSSKWWESIAFVFLKV